MAIFNFHLLK